MPQPQQPQPKQLVWTGAVGGVAALLWVLAIIGVIADEIHAVHAPLVNLCIGMAATASVAATKLALDYRRRGVEREWRAETEAQHTELLDAVRAGTQLQESHYRMVAGRIDEVSEKVDGMAGNRLGAAATIRSLTQQINDGPNAANGGHRAGLPHVDN